MDAQLAPVLMKSQRVVVAELLALTDYDAAALGQSAAKQLTSRFGPDTRHAYALGYSAALKDVRASLK